MGLFGPDNDTVLALRQLQEQNTDLTQRVAHLEEMISYFRDENNAQTAEIKKLISALATLVEDRLTPKAPHIAANTSSKPTQQQPEANQQPAQPVQPPKPQTRIFYAKKLSDTTISPVPDAYAARVPYVAEVTGDQGVVKANETFINAAMSDPESQLFPNYDCKGKTDRRPSAVIPGPPVRIARQGDIWVLESMVQVTFA